MDGRVPHVAQVSFFLDPQGRGPRQMLEDWPARVDVAEAAALGGARVAVLEASATPLIVFVAQPLPVAGKDSSRDVPLIVTLFCCHLHAWYRMRTS